MSRLLRVLFLVSSALFLVSDRTQNQAIDPVGTQATVQVSSGTLILGGNRMSRPYELSYGPGRFVVNGWALPIPKPTIARPIRHSRRELAQIAFGQRAGDLADSLLAAGATPHEVGAALRSMCESSPLVDSIAVSDRAVTWRFRDGLQVQIALAAPMCLPTDRPTREEVERQKLEHLRRMLQTGVTIFILDTGSEVVGHEIPDTLASRVGGEEGRRMRELLRNPLALERVEK